MLIPPPVEIPSPSASPASPVSHLSVDVPVIEDEEPSASTGQAEPLDRYLSWLTSAIVHLLILVALALLVRSTPRHASIVMELGSAQAGDQPLATLDLGHVTETSEPEPAQSQPLRINWAVAEIPVGAPELSGDESSELAALAGGGTAGESTEVEPSKKPGVKFFGTHAYGSKFVYVLDVSSSMLAGNGGRMQRARAELVRSINELGPDQSFYVVLYNNQAIPMFGELSQPMLRPATRENKARVTRWVNSARPNGGTMPAEALRIAGALMPDAVFFLSDGEFQYYGINPMAGAIDQFIQGFGSARASALRRPLAATLSPQAVLDAYHPEIVVHTIAFESEQSRAMMEMIAKSKRGQHRFVPAPQRRRR